MNRRQRALFCLTEIRHRLFNTSSGLYRNEIGSQGKADNRLTSFIQAYAAAFDITEESEYAPFHPFMNDGTTRSKRGDAFAYKVRQTQDGWSMIRSCSSRAKLILI